MATPALAQPTPDTPPNSTNHGVNETTFPLLWSGDTDATNLTTNVSAIDELAAGTDVPFDSPPAAVARWNRGDHGEFPTTNASTSIHPPNARLHDSVVIKDAYVELFAIQPSTRARLTPDDQPRYVAPNGTVYATIDYRLDEPANATTEWTHRIESVRLLVDGRVVDSTQDTHTPTLAYTFPETYRAGEHTIAIEATIVVTPVAIPTCSNGNETCSAISPNVSTDRSTVRDSITVTPYTLSVSGFRAEYPNGDIGLALYKSKPWLGYRFPGGDVRGVWRFYTARDTDWDTLVYSSDDGNRTRNSPLVPLQTFAYPIETKQTPSPRGRVHILETFGTTQEPPALPEAIRLDVLTDPYTASFGLATRIDATDETTPFALDEVTVLGLVRGVDTTPNPEYVTTVDIDRANLTLTVTNRSAETVTVQARLTSVATGEPIDTSTRGGSLVVAGTRVNTTANGTVTVTVPRQDSTVAARYEPGPWWLEDRGYTAASDAVYVGGTTIHFLHVLYRLSVPVSLFLGAVFLIDRFTGWHLWPPWRGL